MCAHQLCSTGGGGVSVKSSFRVNTHTHNSFWVFWMNERKWDEFVDENDKRNESGGMSSQGIEGGRKKTKNGDWISHHHQISKSAFDDGNDRAATEKKSNKFHWVDKKGKRIDQMHLKRMQNQRKFDAEFAKLLPSPSQGFSTNIKHGWAMRFSLDSPFFRCCSLYSICRLQIFTISVVVSSSIGRKSNVKKFMSARARFSFFM